MTWNYKKMADQEILIPAQAGIQNLPGYWENVFLFSQGE
jgi:hypothetical protein